MRREHVLIVAGIILVGIFVAFAAWEFGWGFDARVEEPTAAAHHWMHVLIGFGFSSAGVVVLAAMLLRIVRERDQNRDAIDVSESRFREAFENAPIGMALIKPDGERILVNQALADFLGSSIDELTGTAMATTSGSNTDLDRSMVMRQDVIDGKRKTYTNRRRYQRADGEIVWGDVSGSLVRDSDGAPLYFVAHTVDITELLATQAALEDSKSQLNAAIENISEGFVIFDADDRLVLSNSRFRDMYPRTKHLYEAGKTFEELLRGGAELGEYVDAIGRVDEYVAERMKLRQQPTQSMEQQLSDGRWLWINEHRLPDGTRVGVRIDITDLKNAKDEAEKASRAKTEFLSSMSHELRTPLNAVIGFAQLLERDAIRSSNERQRGHVKQIINGGNHLLALIDQVLDLSKIETGQIAIEFDEVALRDIIADCLQTATTLIGDKDITLVNETEDASSLVLRADRTRVTQVLLNLLSNAIKYNQPGGTITLRCDQSSSGWVRIEVMDTGIGIAEVDFDKVFLPFERLGKETGAIDGSGIGLTISKHLIELMHGKIGFASETESGSTFWIELPISGNAPAQETATAPVAIASESAADEIRTRSILYIEDNPANVELMRAIVEQIPNATLKAAHTAEIGIELANRDLPDLILMDIDLPGMNGLQAINELNDTYWTRRVPVIAVTAAAMPADVKRGHAVGVKHYITKPIDIENMIDAIDDVLS